MGLFFVFFFFSFKYTVVQFFGVFLLFFFFYKELVVTFWLTANKKLAFYTVIFP